MSKRAKSTDHVRFIPSGTTSKVDVFSASVTLTILGKPISSTNRKVQTVVNGRAYSHKNPEFQKYASDFCNQVQPRCRLKLGSMTKPLRVNITAFFPDWRGDLETKGIYDLLQVAGVISNDLYAIEQHHYRAIDKDNPRLEILVEEL